MSDKATATRLRSLAPTILILILVSAIYANTLLNGFVFDDVPMIKNNPAIRSPEYIEQYFTLPFFSVGQPSSGPVAYDYYRPLILVSYLVDYRIWGLNPAGYHFTNILLHAVSTILVFLILRRFKLKDGASMLAAVLFAAHPALADAVAGVSGRSDPLCSMFFLASFFFYVRAVHETTVKGFLFLIFSYGGFTLALLTKENAISLPFLLVAYEVIRPDQNPAERPILRRVTPPFLIAIIYLILRFQVVPASFAWSGDALELARRLATAAISLVSYICMGIFPYNLWFERYTPIAHSLAAPSVIVSLVVVLVLIIIALYLARKAPLISFSIFWFFACMIPYLYFFIFDPAPKLFTPPHFIYLPLIGLLTIFAFLIEKIYEFRILLEGGWRRTISLGALVVVVFLFCLQTTARSLAWRDNYIFFSTMAEKATGTARIRIGLGNHFLSSGQPANALTEYTRAYELARKRSIEELPSQDIDFDNLDDDAYGVLKIADYYAGAALSGMGDAYYLMGETDNAILSYEQALSENAFDARIYYKLGRAYERSARFDEAVAAYERAMKLDQGLLGASSALEEARSKREAYHQADQALQKALLAGEGDSIDATCYRAKMIHLSGDSEFAVVILREALQKDPDHFPTNLELGQIFTDKGDHEAALGFFSIAYSTHPESALVAFKLAVTQLALGNTIMAKEWAARAYELEHASKYWDFIEDLSRKTEMNVEKDRSRADKN